MQASCTVFCVSRGGLDKAYIKVNMGERRKTLKIWLKRTRDRGGVKGTKLQAKDTKNIRGQRQPFQGQTLSRARTSEQVFSKNNNKVFKFLFSRFKKKVFKKVFLVISEKQSQKISKKIRSRKIFLRDLQNFKNSKNTAVLEPRTGQFSRT